MKDFFEGRLLAKPLAAEEIVFKPQRADSIADYLLMSEIPQEITLYTLLPGSADAGDGAEGAGSRTWSGG